MENVLVNFWSGFAAFISMLGAHEKSAEPTG
jgi:hypothetical protein